MRSLRRFLTRLFFLKAWGLWLCSFSYSSRIHRNDSTELIAVQRSISTFHCKIPNILITSCYSALCISHQILVGLSPLSLT